jgi:hypothetical protein
MSNNTKIYFIYKISLFLLILQSMYAWFFWNLNFIILIFTVVVTFVFALSSRSKFSIHKSNIIPIFFLLIIQLYVIKDQNVNSLIVALLDVFVVSMVLLLKNRHKIELFHFFTKAFAILLSISLIGWLFFSIGISLPNFATNFNDYQYSYLNYYFFLLNDLDAILPIPRFSGVFLEPGHIGMITSFLLFGNKFDLKRKEVLVLLIAAIITFSLAAYVLLIFSALIFFVLNSKKPTLNLFITTGLLFGIFTYFTTLNNGNNVVNNLIIERLQVKDDKLVGNNRNSENLDLYYDRFMESDDKYMGIGAINFSQLFEEANAGYKVFMVEHGIVGALLLFLLYFFMVIYNKSKMAFMFLIIYFFSFLQRSYALWDVELLIFITALPIFTLNNSNKLNIESN